MTLAATEARVSGRADEDQCLCSGSALSVEDLLFDTTDFDPSVCRVKLQLASKLGLGQNARLEALANNGGGLNHGIWTLQDSSQSLMLKRVPSQRHHPMIPTESESFQKLARDFPSLLHDRDLAFPLKIFRCRGPASQKAYDLIVMRKAPGKIFSDVINRKWKSRQISELMQDFEALGSFLANVHNKYGLQHGDFQPSNIFFEEASKRFTMIDLADLAPQSSMVQESDVEHFCAGLRLLAKCFGDQLQSEGSRHFKAGYGKQSANAL